jgi:hypothetical protein
MHAKHSIEDFRKLLRNPELALAYFIQMAVTGDVVELNRAINDIIQAGAGDLYPLVELTKLRASPEAISPPGRWDEYRPGDNTNDTSLPVDYSLIGILSLPPRVGGQVKVLRLARNGVVVPGVYESTEVVAVGAEGYTTLNSVYDLKVLPHPPSAFDLNQLIPKDRA